MIVTPGTQLVSSLHPRRRPRRLRRRRRSRSRPSFSPPLVSHDHLSAQLRPMTPRPLQASKSRPLSAIFIGSAGSTPPTLPDLPEPPSPGTSSNASGLPSPPATNSTGSGSVGEGSTNAGSLRHRTPSSKSNSSMSGGVGGKSYGYNKKRSSVIEDEDDADENENDEDHTARLSDDRRRSFSKDAPDNQAALQRVKSLTQRNRMVCGQDMDVGDAHILTSTTTDHPDGCCSLVDVVYSCPRGCVNSSSSAWVWRMYIIGVGQALFHLTAKLACSFESFPIPTFAPDSWFFFIFCHVVFTPIIISEPASIRGDYLQ